MLALPPSSLPFPAMLENELDLDSDAASDATLDDCQRSSYMFGAPLTRMVKFEYLSSPSIQSSEGDELEEIPEYFVRDEEINYIEEDMSLFDLALHGGDGEGPYGDPLLRITSPTYVHSVIDYMAAQVEGSSSPTLSLQSTPSHPTHPLLVRHLPSVSASARELELWRYLNKSTVRRDPWNPSPPALSVVERELATSSADRLAHIIEFGMGVEDTDGEAYIAMDRLWNLQDNPLRSTGDWIDFIRQMLQGLVFLHEHNIAQAAFSFPNDTNAPSIMMDIGLAPLQTHFSRADFPVKYYLLDYAKAVRLRVNTQTLSPRRSRTASPRGRSKSTVLLSASRNHVTSNSSASYMDSLAHTPDLNTTFTLARGRARSDSDATLVSSGSYTPPEPEMDMDTPKQPHFFSRSRSPDSLSDPEQDSGSEETSSEEEDEGVRTVTAATRALLFAADIRNLAEMLQNAMPPAMPLSEALTPVFTAVRQAKALSLSAEDALGMFEKAVRSLDTTYVAA